MASALPLHCQTGFYKNVKRVAPEEESVRLSLYSEKKLNACRIILTQEFSNKQTIEEVFLSQELIKKEMKNLKKKVLFG